MSMIDEMWALLPAVYRRRDAENGDVLRALISIIGEQSDVIRDDIAGMYDNWFIETCDDWVAPYIGELVGARLPFDGGGDATPEERAALARVAPSRMLVANTIRWRRRKGAASLLGQIAWDVARWPTSVVEFGTRVATTQDLRFPVRGGGSADLRDSRLLLAIGGPSDALSRVVDVRDADGRRSPGRFGAANVGLFVFRREIVSVEGVDAAAIDDEGSGQFTFDPLGRDVALHRPAAEPEEPSDRGMLPGPITRSGLATRNLAENGERSGWVVDPKLYGEGAALMIWTRQREGEPFQPVAPDRIVPANLTRWRERPKGLNVAVDPELGRIAFSDRAAPDRVRVAYAYAVTGPRGAVAAKPAPADTFDATYLVAATGEKHHKTLHAALERWRADGSRSALIEFRDSATYDEERLLIDLSKGERNLVIRAAAGCRPTIHLNDAQVDALDAWRVRGGREGVPGSAGSSVILEGLTIGNRGLLLEAYAGALTVRQCTLVPGWSREGGGGRREREAASLTFDNCTGSVSIERSIVGALHVRADEEIAAPLPLTVTDSILDAGEGAVLQGPDAAPYVDLTIRRSTVLGHLTCHGLSWAENSIFSERVEVARRQAGFVRFCFVPPGSRTPRRFSCIPRTGDDEAPALVFVSRTWGSAGYAELAPDCGLEIREGSDDREALGAYHDLYWTARETNLRAVLADYLPAGVNAGVIYVD